MLGFPFIFHRENWIKSGSTNEVKKIQVNSLNILSDIEIESALAHELGHISLNHQFKKTDTTMDLYQMELDADLYACQTKKLQKGTIRGFKRSIILEVLNTNREKKNINAVVKNLYWSHPSYDMRLTQALSVILHK
jgi:Zn-dependent protease with chaperone function